MTALRVVVIALVLSTIALSALGSSPSSEPERLAAVGRARERNIGLIRDISGLLQVHETRANLGHSSPGHPLPATTARRTLRWLRQGRSVRYEELAGRARGVIAVRSSSAYYCFLPEGVRLTAQGVVTGRLDPTEDLTGAHGLIADLNQSDAFLQSCLACDPYYLVWFDDHEAPWMPLPSQGGHVINCRRFGSGGIEVADQAGGRLWIDLEHGAMPRFKERSISPGVIYRLEVVKIAKAGGAWVPTMLSSSQLRQGVLLRREEVRVGDLKVNAGTDAQSFTLRFPLGTEVVDLRGGGLRTYRISPAWHSAVLVAGVLAIAAFVLVLAHRQLGKAWRT